jgi:small-conductance mechanosensitive channel
MYHMKNSPRKSVLVFSLLFTISGVLLLHSQSPETTGPNKESLLQYLNQTVSFYRQLDYQRQVVTDPEDELIIQDNQQIAGQIVALAFEFARTEAEKIETEEAQSGESTAEGGSTRYQALRQTLAGLDQQVRESQAELDLLRRELPGAAGKKKEILQTRIAETQSELELVQARRDSLKSMTEFVGGTSANGLGATGAREKIESLARSVPGAFARPNGKQEGFPAGSGQSVPATTLVRRYAPSGIWGLTSDVFSLSGRIRTLRNAIELTDGLRQATKDMRTPLVNNLRELSKTGDEIARSADSSDPFVLVQRKAILDAVTAQFKQASASVLPLSKQSILFELYRKNLTNWQDSLQVRYSDELRSLLMRLLILVVLLTVVLGGAELWKRAIFRYVSDARRKYQYLLLRKILLWFVIATVLLFSFSSELSSAATFAGLLTAGVAVALQNVILSIVAYFFLIGRYGIRIGDRVQVAGVTGQVVDIGLVRFQLLELISGGEKTASGRVVGFSNSIVFQSTAGFFKQIPGTSFVWHEVTLTVSSNTNYRLVEERLLGVVTGIFSEYRTEMEKQHRHMEKTLTTAPAGALQPISRLRLANSGLEVSIRYPVDLQLASEIDDRVTRELLNVIDHDPGLKPVDSGKSPLSLKTDISN